MPAVILPVAEPKIRRLLLKNTASQMAATALGIALSLFSLMLLSRHLGVDRFGQFTYIFAFSYFFLALNDFGTNTVIVREISKQREKAAETLGSMLSYKLILATVSLVVFWLLIGRMSFPEDLKCALRIYGLILPITALQLPSVMYLVALKAGRLAALAVLNKGIAFILMMCVIGFQGGIVPLAAALVLAEALYLLVLLKDTRDLVRPAWHFAPHAWAAILRSSIPIGVTGLFVAIINQADFILLERITDMRQVGLFAAAHKVTNLMESLPLMVMGTLYPVMSRYAREEPLRLRNLCKKTILGLGAVGIPLGILTTIFAPLIIRLVFGTQFAGAGRGLAVLVWATVFLYIAIPGGSLLISVGKEKLNLMLNALGAALNVSLNLLLIPSLGFVGAAWATVATYLFILLGTLLAMLRTLR